MLTGARTSRRGDHKHLYGTSRLQIKKRRELAEVVQLAGKKPPWGHSRRRELPGAESFRDKSVLTGICRTGPLYPYRVAYLSPYRTPTFHLLPLRFSGTVQRDCPPRRPGVPSCSRKATSASPRQRQPTTGRPLHYGIKIVAARRSRRSSNRREAGQLITIHDGAQSACRPAVGGREGGERKKSRESSCPRS